MYRLLLPCLLLLIRKYSGNGDDDDYHDGGDAAAADEVAAAAASADAGASAAAGSRTCPCNYHCYRYYYKGLACLYMHKFKRGAAWDCLCQDIGDRGTTTITVTIGIIIPRMGRGPAQIDILLIVLCAPSV